MLGAASPGQAGRGAPFQVSECFSEHPSSPRMLRMARASNPAALLPAKHDSVQTTSPRLLLQARDPGGVKLFLHLALHKGELCAKR